MQVCRKALQLCCVTLQADNEPLLINFAAKQACRRALLLGNATMSVCSEALHISFDTKQACGMALQTSTGQSER
jgi:hypothetical protein